ncbi:hypothetical protein PsorP6_017180 [Peronosclerospora sorghi]|uniref:Uncharacterized protein n=1 Tax=Peronosclerospora sorghi TaxID=230839 RepID=A0ACC0WCI3_9STRA|nr:hypothetical protein PsorP6_017180 [Peronosclerospora sorghi]
MGVVSSVRKLTVDSVAVLGLLEPNSVEMEAKRGLGFGGCDIDLGIYFEDVNVDARGQFSPQERVDLLTTTCRAALGIFSSAGICSQCMRTCT